MGRDSTGAAGRDRCPDAFLGSPGTCLSLWPLATGWRRRGQWSGWQAAEEQWKSAGLGVTTPGFERGPAPY